MGNCIGEITNSNSANDVFIVVANENDTRDHDQEEKCKKKKEEEAFIITATFPEQNEKPTNASIECCICSEDMLDDHTCMKPGSCSHKFHIQCYQKLVNYNRRNHLDLRCPLCRTEFSFEPGPAAQALRSMFVDIIHCSEMPFHSYAYDTYYCPYSGKGTIYFASVQSESIRKGKTSSRKAGSYFGNPIKVTDSDHVREIILLVYTDVQLIDIFRNLRVNCPIAEHLFHDELISINDIDVTHMSWFEVNKILRETGVNNPIRKFTISRQELVQFHNYDIEDNLNDEKITASGSVFDCSIDYGSIDYDNYPDRYDYYAL